MLFTRGCHLTEYTQLSCPVRSASNLTSYVFSLTANVVRICRSARARNDWSWVFSSAALCVLTFQRRMNVSCAPLASSKSVVVGTHAYDYVQAQVRSAQGFCARRRRRRSSSNTVSARTEALTTAVGMRKVEGADPVFVPRQRGNHRKLVSCSTAGGNSHRAVEADIGIITPNSHNQRCNTNTTITTIQYTVHSTKPSQDTGVYFQGLVGLRPCVGVHVPLEVHAALGSRIVLLSMPSHSYWVASHAHLHHAPATWHCLTPSYLLFVGELTWRQRAATASQTTACPHIANLILLGRPRHPALPLPLHCPQPLAMSWCRCERCRLREHGIKNHEQTGEGMRVCR